MRSLHLRMRFTMDSLSPRTAWRAILAAPLISSTGLAAPLSQLVSNPYRVHLHPGSALPT